MGNREDLGRNLVCKGCGATGTAEYSENNYMYMKRLDRSVDRIEGPFECVHEEQLKFRCTRCGTET
jgi:hypothetical protein